uniref:AAA+ ATPase domain-containing protein n=1 Tax=viral metagenome TaxID=1070528 RepID=A0A6C0BWG7_9ZZZZ
MDEVNFNDILNRNEIVEQITQILESFRTNKKDLLQKRGIYIYGEPGSGKTTFILNLLKNLEYDVIKYDAGDIRNKNIIDTITKDNMSDKNIMSLFNNKIKPLAILMDEIDGMNNGDKGGINSLIKLIRPKKTKKQKNEDITYNPIICIGNYHVDKKIKELMKVCITIELKKPDDSQISQIIENIMPELESNLKISINRFLKGDLRKLSSIYEIYRNHYSILKNEIIQKIFKPKSYNENTKEITKKLLLKNHTIQEHLTTMNETDRTIVGLMWHENIIDSLENSDKKHSVPFYLKILDNICFSDFMDRIIFQKQIWQLNEMSSLIKTFESNNQFHEWEHKPAYKVPEDIRFTKVLTKYSTEYNNKIFIQNICLELGMDRNDTLNLFLNIRKTRNDAEIYDFFESYEFTKLDIARIYRYIDRYTLAQ